MGSSSSRPASKTLPNWCIAFAVGLVVALLVSVVAVVLASIAFGESVEVATAVASSAGDAQMMLNNTATQLAQAVSLAVEAARAAQDSASDAGRLANNANTTANYIQEMLNPSWRGNALPTLPFTMSLVQLAVNGSIVPGGVSLNASLILGGDDLHTYVDIPALSFTLSQPGFLWTFDTFIPYLYRSSSINYASFPLGGGGVYANFFRDGSMRITGLNGVYLAAGSYSTLTRNDSYVSRNDSSAAPTNFAISTCSSDFVTNLTASDNYAAYSYENFEYFGFEWVRGQMHIVAMENCFAGNAGVPSRSGLAVYYKLNALGSKLSGTPTLLSPTLVANSWGNTVASFIGINNYAYQQGAGLFVNQQNPQLIATVMWDTIGQLYTSGGVGGFYSTNGGVSWSAADPTDQVPIFIFKDAAPANNFFNEPSIGGDNHLLSDKFGVGWWTALQCSSSTNQAQVLGFTAQECYGLVATTMDDGKTYNLASSFRAPSYAAVSLDYPVAATGSDGDDGSQYCVYFKQDATFIELLNFGQTLPIALYCFHTSAPGVVDSISTVQVKGSEAFGYGGIAIGRKGYIYIVGHSPPNELIATQPGRNYDVGPGRFGVFGTGNSPLWFVTCTPSPEIECSTARIIARTDMGDVPLPPQPFRTTWSHPSIVVDKHDCIYVSYLTFLSQNPSVDGYTPSGSLNELLLISSCNNGIDWTLPRRINDGPASCHLNPAMKYDAETHSIGFSFIDTRGGNGVETKYYGTVLNL